MSGALYLSHEGVRIGELEDREGLWRLTYDPTWLANPDAFALSPHLALRPEPYDDADEDGLVVKFFDNLLPEGEARQRLEHRLKVDHGNSFDLLHRFGRETAGAVTIAVDATLVPGDDRYEELPRPAFLERIRRLRKEGGSLLEAARMSLAGAQDKMAVRLQPRRPIELVQGILLPVDQAPTSHIIKPQPADARQLPHVAVNEFFCMSLASRLKIAAPPSHLLFAPGPDDGDPAAEAHDGLEWIYCVQRYDRVHDEGGRRLRRIHQIDFLQLRNEWASTAAKYESAGGAKVGLMFSLAAKFASSRAMAINTLLRRRILDHLVGNADAHWKNRSLLWNRGRWDVAPSYDVVCTMAYPRLDARPALSIGGCMDESRITAGHFKAFAEECLAPHGARIQALTLALKELAEAARREAVRLYDEIAPGVGEGNAAFLRGEVLPVVRARAMRCLEIAAELAPPRAVTSARARRKPAPGA